MIFLSVTGINGWRQSLSLPVGGDAHGTDYNCTSFTITINSIHKELKPPVHSQ